MRNAPTAKVRAGTAPSMAGVALLVSSALPPLAAMAPRLVAQVMFGPICAGHGSLAALHCPACYAAVAMASLGMAILIGAAAVSRD